MATKVASAVLVILRPLTVAQYCYNGAIFICIYFRKRSFPLVFGPLQALRPSPRNTHTHTYTYVRTYVRFWPRAPIPNSKGNLFSRGWG